MGRYEQKNTTNCTVPLLRTTYTSSIRDSETGATGEGTADTRAEANEKASRNLRYDQDRIRSRSSSRREEKDDEED